MSFNFLSSLKYRIALTIFLLEAVLLTVLIGNSNAFIKSQIDTQFQEQNELTIDLLYNFSQNSLLTLEFSELNQIFKESVKSDQLMDIVLLDFRDIVVASSHEESIGLKKSQLKDLFVKPYMSKYFEDQSGLNGELLLLFSDDHITAIKENGFKQTLTIAAVGMIIIAFFGILFGHLLTSQLNEIIKKSVEYSPGEKLLFNENGDNELTDLKKALNRMIANINQSHKKLFNYAFKDSLTEIGNRRQYNLMIDRAAQSATNHGNSFGLLLIDLDFFKAINDKYGHANGDKYLIEFAQLIQTNLRQRDSLLRIGGDEFAIILAKTTESEIKQFAEKIHTLIKNNQIELNHERVNMSASIGASIWHKNMKDIADIQKQADVACYEAKNRGKNCWVLFSDIENIHVINS